MKTRRILSVLLALVIAVGFLPVGREASADRGVSMQNVSISASGILSWDPFEGAGLYRYSVDGHGRETTGTSGDLLEICSMANLSSGTYEVKLYAMDKHPFDGGVQISTTWTGSYAYVAGEKLATPTNVKWNKNKVSWDAVPHAENYIVSLTGGDHTNQVLTVVSCSIDLTNYLEPGTKTYQFKICARAVGYRFSDYYTQTVTLTRALATISSVPISLAVPAVGEHPDYDPWMPSSAHCYSADNTVGNWKNDVIWNDLTDDRYLTPDVSVFEKGHVYKVTVWLTPEDGYAFTDDVTGTLNDSYPMESKYISASNQAYFQYTFPALSDAHTISFVSIQLCAPVYGWTPDYCPGLKQVIFSNGDTDEADNCVYMGTYAGGNYKNDVRWRDVNAATDMIPGTSTFGYDHEYRVEIWVSLKDGYSFSEAVTGTINGNTADSAYDPYYGQACFEYTFPAMPEFCTVMFDSDGGSVVAPQTVKYGYGITAPPNPTKYGYIFKGWYLGSTPYDFSKAVTANFTLKAKWTKAPSYNGTVELNPNDVQFNGKTPYRIYNKAAQKPGVIVKDKNGKVVAASKYTVSYRDNVKPGTAYADVTMKDTGAVASAWFKIYLPATTSTTVENVENGIRISWKKVDDAKGYVIYRRAWNLVDKGWTTFERWNNTTKTTWTDTKVYAGTRYQYGIKAYYSDPMDNYNLGIVGPLKTTVRITTRTLNSVTPGSKKLTAKWSGSKLFTGYEVQVATDANFTKDVKTVTVKKTTTYQTVVKSLKAKTTYYVRVRSYHIFEGTTYYGGWSNVLKGKTK